MMGFILGLSAFLFGVGWVLFFWVSNQLADAEIMGFERTLSEWWGLVPMLGGLYVMVQQWH